MKYLILLLAFAISQPLLAQDAESYEKTIKTFQENFNAQNTDAIFAQYTTELQEEMTKEGVAGFVKGCYNKFGNLKTFSFIETAEGIYSYLVEFEKGTLAMDIKISKEGKISTIQLQAP
ncbi:DUF3887 domain-containing protein [Aquimarina sp. 2201CG5-10]|uniref:DUF3887 domain-containing protein n=1 Tax=Aquimarina callyspongiae TaxID=3098150 RepID=UPI002AB38E03|nr:DUF3887 domain-containing protein [Aquimarina sp. 2201CG5-10]MDY8138246.1 DUF3887 domain-containing protein [Aquimarina sp. 2201CG5-10]